MIQSGGIRVFHVAVGLLFAAHLLLLATACGSSVDEESAVEVREAVSAYMDALDNYTDALEDLFLALPGTTDDRADFADAVAWSREIVKTGRRQLNEYSDEIVLGDPFLNRVDEIVNELDGTLAAMVPAMEQLRITQLSNQVRQLMDQVDRTAEALARKGAEWRLTRDNASG